MKNQLRIFLLLALALCVWGASQALADNYNIIASSPSVSEGVDLTFDVSLHQQPHDGDQVRIDYTVSSGTADSDTDFSVTSGSILFDGTELPTRSFAVTTQGDPQVEPDETVTVNYTVTCTGAACTTNWASQTVNGTILNNDYTITNLSDNAVAESAGNVTIPVTIDRQPATGEEVRIDYATSNISATAGSDYTATSGTLVFTSTSSTTQNIVIPILDDAVRDAENEQFGFALTSITSGNAVLPATASAVITIDDNERILTANLSNRTVQENVGNVTYRVTIDRLPAGSDEVRVNYTTTNNTAYAGSDYTTTSDTLVFNSASSALYQDISIPIVDNPVRETPETEQFRFSLTGVTGNAVLPSPASADITIDDNDYDISISSDINLDVDAGPANIQILVSPPIEVGNPVSFSYATANGTAVVNSDYLAANGTFDSSSNPLTVPVTLLNDGVIGDENFFLNLSAITTGNATFVDNQCQVTIADHQFEITAGTNRTGIEGPGATIDFPITLDRAPIGSEVVTVHWATADGTGLPANRALAGSDYTASSGTLTFDSGTGATQTVTVPIIDNGLLESLETFTVNLPSASVNAAIVDAQVNGNITDDDYQVTTFSDVSVNEGAGTVTLTVRLDRAVVALDAVEFSVSALPGTPDAATVGDDYTAPAANLTIPAGADSGTITMPIIDDTLTPRVEPVETFNVQITPTSGNVDFATGVDNSATVSINVDERYQIAINDVSLTEPKNPPTPSAPMTFAVSINPALQPEHNGLAITFNTTNDSAIAPADFTGIVAGTVTFVTGEASHNLDVTILADSSDEGTSEQFYVDLTAASIPAIVNITDNRGVGTILDDDYAIKPTWNIHGTVTLESPVGTAVAITNGSPVGISNSEQAQFNVQADYRIHSVLIDGVDPAVNLAALSSYVTVNIIDDTHHTYTFGASTAQGLHTIDVLFDHQIQVTATGNGTVTKTSPAPIVPVPSGGPVPVVAAHETDHVFAFAADDSSSECVTQIEVDGAPIGGFLPPSNNYDGDTYTLANVTDNHQVAATFGHATISVLMGADDGATGTTEDAFIQSAASNSGWRAYPADSSYARTGPDFPVSPNPPGAHNQNFTIPSTSFPCDTRFIVIQFLEVDGWLKPADIHINLQNNFKDQQVEGLYDANSHVLTIIATNGTVNRDPVGDPTVGVNRFLYPSGTTVQLAAAAAPSWVFSFWQGDVTGTASSTSVLMDRDRTVEAVFAQPCADADGDGYTVGAGGTGCTPTTLVDCNDTNASIHPILPTDAAIEVCGDGIDQDCSGADLSCGAGGVDVDLDGYSPNQGDCNDGNASVHPGAYDDPATPADEDCYDGAKKAGAEVTCVTTSDVPANAARKPAPPLIMFLLDDSGSMDWEFMTSAENQLFADRYYVNPYPDTENKGISRAYTDNSLSPTERRQWQSQWAGHNRIYFDPKVTYMPWPKWEEVIGAANIRPHEREYDPAVASFPDTAYVNGFTHADMDFPRTNTYDAHATINAMYHPGDAASLAERRRYQIDLNAEFVQVRAGGQQVIVTRHAGSDGTSTYADAIGLSTRSDLELTVGHTYAWYDKTPYVAPATDDSPEIIFDNSVLAPVYVETSSWQNSGGDSAYEWLGNDRHTGVANRSAYWSLNLTAAGDYYVYAWVDEDGSRDNNAQYTVFYDGGVAGLQAATFYRDQSPTNTPTPTYPIATGARWVRLNSTPLHFIAQPGTAIISIPNAHYYTFNDLDSDGVRDAGEDVYLVTIPGSGYAVGNYSLNYYRVNDIDNNYTVNDGELIPVPAASVPIAVKPVRTDASGLAVTDANQLAYMVRQDFADWFSFYRRRILTAKAAVGLTVADMKEVELGIHTINRTYHEPLVYMVTESGTDKINYLRTIYNIRPVGNTPLRRGLYDVGKYFERTNTGDYGNLQTSEGLAQGTCTSPDDSVFWDTNKDSDTDTCDDSGGECQRAFVIAMTDGYDNVDFENPNYPYYQNVIVGNRDTASSVPVFRDGVPSTLSDVAMYFYDTDLDTILGNNVPAKGFDDNARQHVVTYTVAFGVSGFYKPDLFPDCLPGCDTPGQGGCPDLSDLTTINWATYSAGTGPFTNVCPQWWNDDPNNTAEGPRRIDDLFHAAVNSRGKFLNAADPGELVASMKVIKDLIDDQVGTASSVSINANKIQEDTLLFQTTYDSSDWNGDVLAKCLDSSGALASCTRVTCESGCDSTYDTCLTACAVGDSACEQVCKTARTTCYTTNNCAANQTCTEAHTSCVETCGASASCKVTCDATRQTCLINPPEVKWSAAKNLAVPAVAEPSRQIITADNTGAGLAFRWATLPASMRTQLMADEHILNYLRGERSYERQNDITNFRNFRNRTSRLGDFINSEPYHYDNTVLDIDWVFVGGNDGMLHVFDGNTGDEVFAYVPQTVFSNLHLLSTDSYNDNHKFFVDGYVTVKDLGTKVVLVGGLGKGGKGFFALDLTEAAKWAKAAKVAPTDLTQTIEAHADKIVLWEYSDITYAATPDVVNNLGYSFSRPQIVKSNDASVPWILVFGNGYESVNKRAALFTLGLGATGAIAWSEIIDTGIGGTTPNCNGLSTPAIIFPQGDTQDDFIYAGDLLGNLWKFDISATDRNSWEIYFEDSGGVKQPLFQARSNAGWRQPITMQPDVTTSCAIGTEGYLVTFGTGRMLNPDEDFLDQSVQTVYGIWDWSKTWESEGVTPEHTYLGTFQAQDSSATTGCLASCSATRGSAAVSGSCIYDCAGDAECITACETDYASCTTNCGAIRNLSNVTNITSIGASSADYVTLLQQTQVWGGGVNYKSDGTIAEQVYGATDLDLYDQIVRVVSDNMIDWYLPSQRAAFTALTNKTAKHVGWYFDLPTNGERIVRDMTIVNNKLIFTSTIPSDSPCESGGNSFHWSVDACTGGRLGSAFFDLNDDEMINGNDYINIGTAANPIWVPASSIMVEGLGPAGTVVEVDNNNDRFYFTGKGGEINDPSVTGFGIPVTHWRDLEWK